MAEILTTMQKNGVKTLSIIDTISELATDKTEASRLTLPSPISVRSSPNSKKSAPSRLSMPANMAPQLQPRHAKLSVSLMATPPLQHHESNGAKPRFLASSPRKSPQSSMQQQQQPKQLLDRLNLSAINKNLQPPIINSRNSGATRGQTPDWIRDIFVHAKRGHHDKLEAAMEGLEPTLIRNLTDHLGNNLLHTVCANGHTHLLPWLTARFTNEMTGALMDENKKGLTPGQTAIKLGKLQIVQWLVRHTGLRDKLLSRDGERSLMHSAAKYGKDDIVSWLAEELFRQQLDVDQLDIGSNSPLHLAAKQGQVSTVSVLLHHGAQVALKNDMGLKPQDCAKLMNKSECAEFLLLYEASLDLSRELSEAQTKRDFMLAEHAELKGHFKEVLNVGKRLAKERDEMCRELKKLHDSTMELHDKMIMEIQVLRQENNSLRRNGFKQEKDNMNNSTTIDACTALHERWQQHSKHWFSSNLAEAEHKLLLADEGWRRSRTATYVSGQGIDQAYPQRSLRDRIEEIRGQSLPSTTAGAAALVSTPEGSDQDEDDDYEDLDSKPAVRPPPPPPVSVQDRRISANIAQRKKLATPCPSQRHESRTSLDESVYSSLSNEVYTKIGSPSQAKPNVNESGGNTTASVIEVIEPTSSEEEEFKRSLREMNWSLKSPITIFPRQEVEEAIVTLNSSNSGGSIRQPAAPVKSKSPGGSSKTSRESVRSKYSSSSEMSPTKRLLEMGISTATLDDADEPPEQSLEEESNNNQNKKKNFLQKIKTWKSKSKKEQQMYANVEQDQEEDQAEEHILPDSFDDDHDENEDREDKQASNGGQVQLRQNKSSVSPSSRKSASSQTSKTSSVTTSEDSGILVVVQQNNNKVAATGVDKNEDNKKTSTGGCTFKLGKIEEVHKMKMNNNNVNKMRFKRRENKAWYDVPSDDDPEAPEADSLASIISHRGSSDEED